MKQRHAALSLFSALAWGLWLPSSQAQITVNEGDLPLGGQSYTFQNLTPDLLLDYASSGPGWIWDFTEAQPVDSTVQEVLDIDEASALADLAFNAVWDPTHQADHFYEFLALQDLGEFGLPVDIESVMAYYQIANGTYTQVGLGLSLSGFEFPFPFEDVDEVFPVPLNADATLESTAAYEVDVPGNLYYGVDQTRESIVDGYGTLMLPDGTSHEVLRVRSTVNSADSVFVTALGQGFAFERETVTYSWLGDGGMPWMEVSTTLGVPTLVRYQGSAPAEVDTSASVVSEWDERRAPLFPNPANRGQDVLLSRDAASNWSVLDASGNRVLSVSGSNLATSGLRPGLYLIRNEATGLTRRLVVK